MFLNIALMDYTKADDVAWRQRIDSDLDFFAERKPEASRCVSSDDVPVADFDDCFSGRKITFD